MKRNKLSLFFLYETLFLCSFLTLSGMERSTGIYTIDDYKAMSARGEIEMSVDAKLLIGSNSSLSDLPISYSNYDGTKFKASVIIKAKNRCLKNTKTKQEIIPSDLPWIPPLLTLPLNLFEQNENNTIYTTVQVGNVCKNPDEIIYQTTITPLGKHTPKTRGNFYTPSCFFDRTYRPEESFFIPLTINLVGSNGHSFLEQLEPYKQKFLKNPTLLAENIREVRMAIEQKRIKISEKDMEQIKLLPGGYDFAERLINLLNEEGIKLEHGKRKPKTYQEIEEKRRFNNDKKAFGGTVAAIRNRQIGNTGAKRQRLLKTKLVDFSTLKLPYARAEIAAQKKQIAKTITTNSFTE